MKCKRCGAEMQRRKLKENSYQYRCPKCGFTIGSRGEQDNAYKEAYTSAMSRAAAEE